MGQGDGPRSKRIHFHKRDSLSLILKTSVKMLRDLHKVVL